MEEDALEWLANNKFTGCQDALESMATSIEAIGEMEVDDVALLPLSNVEKRRFLKCVGQLQEGEEPQSH